MPFVSQGLHVSVTSSSCEDWQHWCPQCSQQDSPRPSRRWHLVPEAAHGVPLMSMPGRVGMRPSVLTQTRTGRSWVTPAESRLRSAVESRGAELSASQDLGQPLLPVAQPQCLAIRAFRTPSWGFCPQSRWAPRLGGLQKLPFGRPPPR